MDAANSSSQKANPVVQENANRSGCIMNFLGLTFICILASALFSYGAYLQTSESKMKATFAKTLDIIVRQEGVQKATPVINYLNEISKHKKELSSLQTLSTIDQSKIENDLKTMSPEQSQKYLEEQIAGPLYESSKVVESLKKVDPDAKIDTSQLEFFNFGNSNINDLLRKTLIWQGAALILLLLFIVLLSRGIKKLLTPGILILIGTLPGLLFFRFFDKIITKLVTPYLGNYASTPVYNDISKEIITPLILDMRNVYIIPAIVGVALIVLVIIIKIIIALVNAVAKNKTTQRTA